MKNFNYLLRSPVITGVRKFFCAYILVMLSAGSAIDSKCVNQPAISITTGIIRGLLFKDFDLFQSTSYIGLPVGNLRWERPQSSDPVIVALHGGGSQTGAGAEMDSRRLTVLGGIVVVTINYQLNVFGYFGYPGGKGAENFAVCIKAVFAFYSIDIDFNIFNILLPCLKRISIVIISIMSIII